MKKHKILSLLLAVILIFNMIEGFTWGYAAANETDFSFDSATGTITKYIGAGGDVIIPNTIRGVGVTSIGTSAFRSCNTVTSVTIPSNVTSINQDAFFFCGNLTSITISNNVTSIGQAAFRGCKKLTTVTMPSNLISIGQDAFMSCEMLTAIEIPNGVASIGKGAFANCSALTSIDIPESVTSIGEGAFYRSGLTSFTIPAGITSIEKETFYGCEGLTSITMLGSITSIGDAAFMFCKELTIIDIPNSVSYIGSKAFYSCKNLRYITIPYGITSIEAGTFSDCGKLESVSIPSSVTAIGGDAFKLCKSLKSISIPSGVTTIGDYAFSHCEGLTSVTIPGTVTSVGESAFFLCTGLQKVYFNGDAPSIPDASTFDVKSSDFNIYIKSTSTGFGGALWGGYKTNKVDAGSLKSIAIDSSIVGGTIKADVNEGMKDETIHLDIKPNVGWRLKAGSLKYTANGTDTPITGASFIMPAASVMVKGEFEKISIKSFDNLASAVKEQNVYTGILLNSLMLPSFLSAKDSYDNRIDVGVMTWKPSPAYDPSIPGNYTFTAELPAGSGYIFSGTYPSITVIVNPAPQISTANPPSGEIGKAYSGHAFTTTGGIGEKTYSISAGSLPKGLILSPKGELTGTPTQTGKYKFTVKAADNILNPLSSSYEFSMDIAINETAVIIDYNNETISFDDGVYALNSAADFGLSTTIEKGESINRKDLCGKTLYIRVIKSPDIRASVQIKQRPAAPTAIPDGSITRKVDGFSFTPEADTVYTYVPKTGGTVNLVAAGNVTGLMPGTEYTLAAYKNATATEFRSKTTEQTVKTKVKIEAPTLTGVTTGCGCKIEANKQEADAGDKVIYTLTACESHVPAGISVNSAGAALTANGTNWTYEYTVKAEDKTVTAQGQYLDKVAINKNNPISGEINKVYSYTFGAAGGNGAKTYELAAGSVLPPGLALSTSGSLTGTPTQAGSYSFTVKVSDSSSTPLAAQHTFTMYILPDASAVNIDYTNETISYDNKYEVSSDASFTEIIANNSKLSEGCIGGKIYIRIKANGGIPESPAAEIQIKQRPAAPTAIPDINITRQTNGFSFTPEAGITYTYKQAGGAEQCITGGSVANLTPGTEHTLAAYRNATATEFKSAMTFQTVKTKVKIEAPIKTVNCANCKVEVEGNKTEADTGDKIKYILTPCGTHRRVALSINNTSVQLAASGSTYTYEYTIKAEDKTITAQASFAKPTLPPPPPTPQQDIRTVPGEAGDKDHEPAIGLSIIRTKAWDGTKLDTVTLEWLKTREAIEAAKTLNWDKVRAEITDIPGNNADRIDINIPVSSMTQFGENGIGLNINTEKAKLRLSKETTEQNKDKDIQISISEVRSSFEQEETRGLIATLSAGAEQIGISLSIKTNYTGRTQIIIPLKPEQIPIGANLEEFLKSLRVLIQHSDGENKIQSGEIEYDTQGRPVGISIWVDKFSTFTIIKVKVEEEPQEPNGPEEIEWNSQGKFMPDKEIRVKMNMEIDETTLTEENLYVVDSEKETVKTKLSYEAAEKVIKVVPESYYKAGESYSMYITKNILSKEGKMLRQRIKYNFTIGDMALDGVKLSEQAKVVKDNEWILLTFDRSIDITQYKGNSIELYDENCNQIEAESEMTEDKILRIKSEQECKEGKVYYLIIKDFASHDEGEQKSSVWIKFTISSVESD